MSVETLEISRPKNILFTFTVGASLLAHVIVITMVHFSTPDPAKLFNRESLEIVLVNARSKNAPKNADVLAQHNLDGGGNSDDPKARITSPLPPKDVVDPSNEFQTAPKSRVADLEEQQRKLLTSLGGNTKVAPETLKDRPAAPTQPLDLTARYQASEMARLQGEVAREISEYGKKPRIAFVGGKARGIVTARYVDDWRIKIERIGTFNYPKSSSGQRLSGSMLITVEINADGTLRSVNIEHSSGNKELDEAAKRIVTMSTPFASLPAGIVDENGVPAAILSITKRWTFTRSDNALQSQ